jgi:hypothetical protein
MKEKCVKCNGARYYLKEYEHYPHTKMYTFCKYCLGSGEVDWIDNIFLKSNGIYTIDHLIIMNKTSDLIYLATKCVPLNVGKNWIPRMEREEYLKDSVIYDLAKHGDIIIYENALPYNK